MPVDEVERSLSETARDIRRAMLDVIPDAEPNEWLYQLVRDYPSRPGKALRPALCISTCRAFGGSSEDVFPIAVAIELLHNAFLVHDDIADGSERRRGRPTLAAEFGTALALNAGDALGVLANQVLRRHVRSFESHLADRVLEEFDAMAMRTIEGQAIELGWRADQNLSLVAEDYLNLILHKTCWYTTIHPLRVGALVGSRGSADLQAMVRFGFYLGAAFQIRDDLLNLTGDQAVYGKEINGDLFEAKRTLALIHLGGQVTGVDHKQLKRYLALDRSRRTEQMVSDIRRLLDKYGSIQFAHEFAQGIAAAAFEAYDEAFGECPDGEDARLVRALVPYMLTRAS